MAYIVGSLLPRGNLLYLLSLPSVQIHATNLIKMKPSKRGRSSFQASHKPKL